MVNNSQSSVAVGASPSKKVQQQQQNQGNNNNSIHNRNHPQTQQQQQQNGAGEASNRRRKSSTSTNNATNNNNNNAAANETMGMGMDGVGGGGGNFLPGPTSFMDFSLGMLTQCARRYMFIDVTKKALVYLALVAVLSILTKLVPLPTDWYISQKHNVFNRFGTKIGWFWTTLLLCPFMWLTSLLHHESRLKAAYDQMRLLVATCLWYICTNAFVKFENQTGKCHGAVGSARNDCFSDGGKWIPGFDISGHCFLLIYSMLLIAEECTSFRNWPSKPRVSVQHIPSRRDYERFQQSTKFIQWNFVLLFLLHLLWDFQLVVTALYYHDFWQKMIGATIAVVCWAVTYRFWFLVGFPFLPIRRHIKSF